METKSRLTEELELQFLVLQDKRYAWLAGFVNDTSPA